MTATSDAAATHHRAGFIALIGKPNVGKSTLLNACLGTEVVITSPTPQTTRDRVLGILTRPEAQLIFVDTPGLLKPHHRLGRVMRRTALQAIQDVDLIVVVVDAKTGLRAGDQTVLDAVERARQPVILAINKIDAAKKAAVLPIIDRCRSLDIFTEFVPISAQTGEQLDVLLDLIIAALPCAPPWYGADQHTDRPMTFHVSERIREQILRHTRQEVPHAAAIVLEEWTRRRDDRGSAIRATIVIERDTQRAILIGKHGSMLKRIGQAARQSIETLLHEPVYLELWVKVVPSWRNDDSALRRFGYTAGG